jgi:hypothetical protein
MLTLAAMFIVVIGGMAWLHNKEPGYAYVAIVVLSIALGLSENV